MYFYLFVFRSHFDWYYNCDFVSDVIQEDILIFIDLDKLGKYGDSYKIINMSTEMVWNFQIQNWWAFLSKQSNKLYIAGADSGGGGAPGALPPKIGKNMIFFGVKSWFFTWNTPKISRTPPKIEKIWYFGVKPWFFTRNTPKIFAPPSARRNFFKCAPLTWNPGSAPALVCLEFMPMFAKQICGQLYRGEM